MPGLGGEVESDTAAAMEHRPGDKPTMYQPCQCGVHFPVRLVGQEKGMSRSSLLSRTGAVAWLLLAGLILFDGHRAVASTIKMAFPGPATTFSLPLYVAQAKGWLGELKVEEIVVTGDANAMRVLLSGNADIALVGTFNVLASIHAPKSVPLTPGNPSAITALCWRPVRGASSLTSPERPSLLRVLARCRTSFRD
jgi:hypothetical protein